MEGAIVMVLVAATKDAITFENGKSKQTNFHINRMLRINEMPAIEVHILTDGGPVIKGVGEPGLPPLAPAVQCHFCGYGQTDPKASVWYK
jgi:isoquinoline 1-oxidoreductase beta subunit